MRFNRGRRYSHYSPYSSRKGLSRSYGSRGYSRGPRIRWERVAIIAVCIALVIGVLVWFNFSRIQLMMKGYSFSEQNEVLKLSGEEVDEILSHDKMKYISSWIQNSQNVKYYDEYEQYYTIHKDLKYKEVIETVDNYFDNYIPKIQALNYTDKQIWEILKTADSHDLQYLIDKGYSYSQIEPYMQVKGYKFSDMDKYMKVYKEKKNYNYAVLVTTYPFIISSNKSSQSYTITNTDDISILVKTGFILPPDYEPKDLVKPDDIPVAPDCDHYKLRKEAAQALTKMYNAAKKEGYHLVINSAYRSYKEQQKTYEDYFKRYDEVTAAGLVAYPGTSEHQTGLGVDLTSQSVVNKERLVFGDTVEYKWCQENAHKFGYILRFEENKSDITGIAHEPWHFRYVGVEVATKIYEKKWTYEEYCLYNGVIPTIKEN